MCRPGVELSSLLWQTLLLLTKHVRASHTDLTLCRCVCLFVCPCVCLPSLVSLSHTPLSLSLNLSLRDRVHFQRSFQRLHPKMRGTRWGRRVLVVFDVPGKCMLLFRVLVLSCSLPYACAAVHVAAARCGGRLCNDAPARGNARAQLPSRCHRTHA